MPILPYDMFLFLALWDVTISVLLSYTVFVVHHSTGFDKGAADQMSKVGHATRLSERRPFREGCLS